MIKKFNEYNTEEKDLMFNKDDLSEIKNLAEETLIEMIDNGFDIHSFITTKIENYNTIYIIISNKRGFKYPLVDIQQQHFIDFLDTLYNNYTIKKMIFENISGYHVSVEPHHMLNGSLPNNSYPDMKFRSVSIQIRKKI